MYWLSFVVSFPSHSCVRHQTKNRTENRTSFGERERDLGERRGQMNGEGRLGGRKAI